MEVYNIIHHGHVQLYPALYCPQEKTVPMQPLYMCRRQHPSPRHKQKEESRLVPLFLLLSLAFLYFTVKLFILVCTVLCLFVTHIRLTTSDCFIDRAIFANRWKSWTEWSLHMWRRAWISLSIQPFSAIVQNYQITFRRTWRAIKLYYLLALER